MPLPSVSANVLLAAACGSAVTCALQWAYTKFLGNNNSEKGSSHSLRGSRKKRNNSVFNKMEQGCLPEDTTLENSLPEHEAQCCAAIELGAVNGRTGKSGSSNRHFYCEVTDDGLAETNREVGNFPEEDSENANEVIEGDVYSTDSAELTFEMEHGASRKPQTADKGIATDESGFCKGDEDIVMVDRKLMQFMIHTMGDMEKRLLRYEGGSSEQISLLEQLFQ